VLKNPKLWIAIIALIAVGVVIKLFFPFTTEAVRASVAVAPEVIFEIGSFPVTPTILTMVLVFILLAEAKPRHPAHSEQNDKEKFCFPFRRKNRARAK